MILGRNTGQWLSLLGGISGLILLFVQQFAPEALPQATTILAGITTFAGFFMTWLTATQTTPIADARLVVGTPIAATDATGAILGHVTVPEPVVEQVEAGEADGQP